MAVPDSIQFNVIFVPGTVRRLAPFILSLLDSNEHCRFRLVSNACHESEDQVLHDLAKTDRRLSFVRIGHRVPLSHGVALTLLQHRETSPVFAFMDSDIFATGDFLEELDWSPSQSAARFSCPPVWSNPQLEKLPEQFGVLSGTYNRLHDDFCVGSSYFAVYDNEVLTQCIQQTGINFEYSRWTQLPWRLRLELRRAGKEMLIYDTGKLLNILLQLKLHSKLDFHRLNTVEHIGAVSCRTLQQTGSPLRQALRSAAQTMPRSARLLCWHAGMHYGWRDLLCDEEVQNRQIEQHCQQRVYRHFMRLLRSPDMATDSTVSFGPEHAGLIEPVTQASMLLQQNYSHWRLRVPDQTHTLSAGKHLDAGFQLRTCLKAA